MRLTLRQAFERLRQLGLIQNTQSTKSKTVAGGIFQVNRLMPFPQIIDELAKTNASVYTSLKRFCKDRQAAR
jgi:hypothetical protein